MQCFITTTRGQHSTEVPFRGLLLKKDLHAGNWKYWKLCDITGLNCTNTYD